MDSQPRRGKISAIVSHRDTDYISTSPRDVVKNGVGGVHQCQYLERLWERLPQDFESIGEWCVLAGRWGAEVNLNEIFRRGRVRKKLSKKRYLRLFRRVNDFLYYTLM